MHRTIPALFVLCAVPALAEAQSPAPAAGPAALLDRADMNGDHQISRAEFLAARRAMFSRLDTNGDGQLSKKEFQESLPAGRARTFASSQFSRFDTNGDGMLSAVEYNAAPTPLFDRADKDGNGVLSSPEIAALRREAGG